MQGTDAPTGPGPSAGGTAPPGDDLLAVFAAIPTSSLLLAPDAPRFTILAATDAYCRETRTPREALLGHGVFEFVFPEVARERHGRIEDALRASLAEVLRTGAPHRMEVQRYDLPAPDGGEEARYWQAHNAPVPGPGGGVRFVLHQAEDVTAQVLAGEAAERRATRILERIGDAHFTLDAGFRVVSMNPAMERWMGAPAHRFLGRTHGEVFPAAAGTPAEAHYRRIMAGGGEAHFTQRYTDAARDRVMEVDAYGTPDGGAAVFARDVTERVRAEAEREAAAAQAEAAAMSLRVAEARLRHALEVAALGAWDLDLVAGGAWRALRHDQIFGYPGGRAEWTYDDFLAHVHPDDRVWVDERFGGAIASGGAWDFTCRIRRADDGAERWISARGEVVADAEGRPERMIGVVRDVTDQQLAEQALREARDAAEAANRAKSEFLAVMSHELRTPLNAIGGYAELIEMGIRGPVTEQQRDDLARIQASQRHLLGLINEVLNYARLESGAVRFDPADVHVCDALAEAQGLVAPQARAKGLTLGAAGCPEDLMVRADP
ncbi:MAG TPA: PAS domain-containing protein, partial [Longimicrobiaceae bacterium]|nr:PAS domain-containing protein [Longimicrobiaceae bacterium]